MNQYNILLFINNCKNYSHKLVEIQEVDFKNLLPECVKGDQFPRGNKYSLGNGFPLVHFIGI